MNNQSIREKINQYLETERKIESAVVRETLIDKVTEFEDICTEFLQWLESRNYDHSALEISSYTAKAIHDMAPALEGIGVYNFLVTLRKNPEEAKRIIKDGFHSL